MPTPAGRTAQPATARHPRPRTVSWRRGHSTALTVYGYGIRLFVDRGRLIVEDGFANEGERRRTIFSRGTCQLQRIVVGGRTGMISMEALNFLGTMGIVLLFVGVGGRLTSIFTPGGLEGNKVRLHRAQVAAKNSEVGLRVARLLISKKLEGQFSNLRWLTDPGRQVPAEERPWHHRMQSTATKLEALIRRLDDLTSVEELVLAERAGAELYWSVLSGIPLRWKPRDAEKVPSHWLTTQPRESFRTGNRYGATDPANALLNYGYALLEAETRIACLNVGLHPGMGIFHADKDGRASFVYDLMEPLRPVVDRLVLDLIRGRIFTEGECWETRDGFCRLDPDLAARLTSWIPRLRSAVTPVVHEVTSTLVRYWLTLRLSKAVNR